MVRQARKLVAFLAARLLTIAESISELRRGNASWRGAASEIGLAVIELLIAVIVFAGATVLAIQIYNRIKLVDEVQNGTQQITLFPDVVAMERNEATGEVFLRPLATLDALLGPRAEQVTYAVGAFGQQLSCHVIYWMGARQTSVGLCPPEALAATDEAASDPSNSGKECISCELFVRARASGSYELGPVVCKDCEERGAEVQLFTYP